jgi:hypothetical protein
VSDPDDRRPPADDLNLRVHLAADSIEVGVELDPFRALP